MTRLSGKFKNFSDDARYWGWCRALSRRIATYMQRIAGLHIYKVGIRDLKQTVKIAEVPAGIKIRHLALATLPMQTDLDDVDLSDRFLRASLERGDRVVAAFSAERIIGYAITATDTAPHSNDVWVEFGASYSYLYKVFVRPDYRGQRIAQALILRNDEAARADGFTLGLVFVSIANFASLAMRSRVAATPAGYAGYLRIGSRFRAFRTNQAKQTGFKFVR